MKFAVAFGASIALACVPLNSIAVAASAPGFVATDAQNLSGGRSVQVLVAQSELKSDINHSAVSVAMGGGLLGGLIDASINAERAKKAELLIEPIRASLTGFDVDTLAMDTTRSGLGDVDWLQPTSIDISKDSSLLGKSAMLDKGSTSQIAFIEYTYDASPSFDSIRVVARIDFANKAVPPAAAKKPEQRLLPKYLAYTQTITSVVTLTGAGTDKDANAALWGADGGRRTREALTLAFAEIQKLLPRTLALTDADIKLMNAKDKKRGMAGGFPGRIQESTGTNTLLWGPGFIRSQTIS
jgi:hypothetical protein